MIAFPEEKRSNGYLIAFVDLMFLLVAFFTLLLFFIQEQRVGEEELDAMHRAFTAIVGEDVEISEAMKKLTPALEAFMEHRQEQSEREQQQAQRAVRQRARTTYRLVYTVLADGSMQHEGKRYTLAEFEARVLAPLREKHWIAFRAYAQENTPFGLIVASRRRLLTDAGEFDTYWDNVTRNRQK